MNRDRYKALKLLADHLRTPPKDLSLNAIFNDVKDEDLENTTYLFELENGEKMEVKGNEEIEYDGELHSAANLFDAMKEGYYGKF